MNMGINMSRKNATILHDPTYSNDILLWTDKKRPFFGRPWSFTRYSLYTDHFVINYGLLTLHQEELRLYRILDVTLRQTLFQRIFGVGSLVVHSTDSTMPKFMIQDVKDPYHVMKLLVDYAEIERMSKGLAAFECFDTYR